MDSLMVDGNAIAGLLHDVFGAEMTEATGTCANCGASAQVGAVHVFRSAGVVLRCPQCGSVLAKIVTRQAAACVDLSGLRALA
jgi:Zn finger protein HypA/HybF involved in hydrogenase expression